MVEKMKPMRKGGGHYVAGAPNNQSSTNTSYTPGIAMHQFPVDRAVREKWLKFVQRHRVDFQRADFKACLIVLRPFREGLLRKQLAFTLEGMAHAKRNKVLIKGSIPTIHAVVSEVSEELTDRKN
ncbi:hypothetical protein pdam_00017571 [Pocillopora damicornis]|uniref:THAP-type domain-containing protein n=1 Tax=Pocillopora damicornis TaxID=46731 RepID=A0A3M6TRV8_POCDA|nr:hypothetical protein pdam_00017571 [Pocillopora damicornis]